MARTKHKLNPISIVVTDPRWGTVALTPGRRGQKYLRGVPAEHLPKVIAAIEAKLTARLKGTHHDICQAVERTSKKRAEALVALEQGEPLNTGGLSDKDHADHPFGFPVHT